MIPSGISYSLKEHQGVGLNFRPGTSGHADPGGSVAGLVDSSMSSAVR